MREVTFQGITQTVYSYRFWCGDDRTWAVEYFGRYYWSWCQGGDVMLKATIKEQSERWRCTKIARPVTLDSGKVPLFA